jgi:ribA/ribD-fused uncharacterized protein
MIDAFSGKYRFLSNFWPAEVTFEGEVYFSVEHAYQAAKFLDPKLREKIRLTPLPAAAKKLGKGKGIRPDWDSMKQAYMSCFLDQKFSDPALANSLLATGDEELVEGNWWGDTYWGVCKGVGENRLGKLLMQIRKELQDERG